MEFIMSKIFFDGCSVLKKKTYTDWKIFIRTDAIFILCIYILMSDCNNTSYLLNLSIAIVININGRQFLEL